MQDLCRTDPRGVQLLQALGAVQNSALPPHAFPGLHGVAQAAFPAAATVPHVLASPSLPPLCPTDSPQHADGSAAVAAPRAAAAEALPNASAAAAEAPSASASPVRKRGKRGRAGATGAAAQPVATAAVDPGGGSSRATKRTRLSPLGSPGTAEHLPASSGSLPTAPGGVAAAQDLMALLSQQLPHSSGIVSRVAQQAGHAPGDAALPMHGVATAAALAELAAAAAAPPLCSTGAFTVVPPCAAPNHHTSSGTGDPRSGLPHRRRHSVQSAPGQDSAPCRGDAAGSQARGIEAAAARSAAGSAAGGQSATHAVASSAPLSPEQRAHLAQRLEAVFGGMGMDSATISAGLAIALGINAGRGLGR